ncbi:MAG: MoaD family protein [Candidatus Hydrothermarchaeaceae archaeon]
MVTVRLATPLRKFSGGKPEMEARGSTLRKVLEYIDSKSPGFKDKIIENNEIKMFVNVYVNNEDVRLGSGLNTKLDEKDVVSILPAVSGG